jgi:hypothetical protein
LPDLEKCFKVNETCNINPLRKMECCSGLYCVVEWAGFGSCAQKNENLCKTKYQECNADSNECCETLGCLLRSDNKNYCMLLE